MNNIQYISRYPGIRPYEEHEEALFFGRNQEVNALFSLVKVHPLVVLFSKSGLGKSSLINAALIPKLRKTIISPVKIRFQNVETPPIDHLKNALSNYLDQDRLIKHTQRSPKEASLWEYLQACTFEQNGTPHTPMFIFDQFEEFFNFSSHDKRAFITSLADLIHGRLPEKQQYKLLEIPRQERSPDIKKWFRPVTLKVLIAIRSDRLSELDELSKDLPTILRSRFQLKALQEQQTKQAIIEPAQLSSAILRQRGSINGAETSLRKFRTKPFEFTSATLAEIVNSLSDKNGQVESFQLQIVCQHIEDQVQKMQE